MTFKPQPEGQTEVSLVETTVVGGREAAGRRVPIRGNAQHENTFEELKELK